ncbi:MAG: endonuclease III [Candidatus Bathyarchaeota archaeon]|nr:MAG: endonuclease III [Candidatus Bathyarchaeota archaeon]
MSNKNRSQRIVKILKQEYTGIEGTALHFNNALELLVSAILSAQCTDERVNKVTEILFEKYKTALEYANADIEELQNIIKPTGFYRNKAKFIKSALQKMVDDFDSKIPRTMEEMTQLPGVARKTANLVLSNAFDIHEGVIVDTHVLRLSKRLGFSKEKDRDKIERDLMNLFPHDQWFELSNLMIAHGRTLCKARKPTCRACVINHLCPSAFTFE